MVGSGICEISLGSVEAFWNLQVLVVETFLNETVPNEELFLSH